MKKMVKLTIGFLLSCLLVSVFATTQIKDTELFVIHAKSGNVTQTNNYYQLNLQKPRITYFTDRPVRLAGSISVKQFVSDWSTGQNSFARVNPNAALIADFDALKAGDEQEHFVILKNPSYDPKTDTLTLNVSGFKASEQLMSGELTDIMLFVHSNCMTNPGGPNCW